MCWINGRVIDLCHVKKGNILRKEGKREDDIMKKTCLLIIMLLGLTAINSVGYVLLYPGAIFYGANQTITFSDTVNCSFIEVGDDYFILSDMNFTLEGLSSYSCEYNLSFFNDTFDNHTTSETPYRFFELNCTYAYTGNAEITIDMPSDYYLIDLYIDGTLEFDNVEENTGGYYVFDHTWNSVTSYRLCFYIDGYLPSCPTNASSTYDANTTRVNLSWTGSSSADTYAVVRNNASYPSTVTDGYEVQNSSALFYNDTLTSNAYFTVWAYNNSGYYSPDSCKLDIPWGAIVIFQVYNESAPWKTVEPFGILISNETGTETYWDSTATAPLYISKDNIPFGINTVITINASKYKTIRYYYDFELNNFYNLTFYIAPTETYVGPDGGGDEDESGENYTTTRLYRLRVIDEYIYPISGAKVNIKRYMNTTDTYENTTIVITDGYGESDIYLVPNILYKIFITKDGFTQTGSNDWIPDPVFYGASYPKIFQMERTEPDIETKAFWDIITFNGTMHTNGSLHIFYTDTEELTTNAQFHTNEVYNFTITLQSTNSTTLDSFDFWVTGLNISRVHKVTIHLNHTTLGWINITITINPLHTPKYEKDDIESKSVAVFGIFTPGYANFFLIFIPAIILLLVFGPKHAGIGIIGAGLYMGFSSIFIAVPAPILTLVPFIVAIGFIYIIVKEGGVKL